MTKEEYRNVLNNIAESFGTLKDQVNQAFEVGRSLGVTDSQIGSDVRSKIKGLVSISTIQRMLPDSAKQQQTHIASEKVVKLTAANPNRRLVVPEEPSLPAPPEVHQEAEIVREPPKAIEEPIRLPPQKSDIIEVVFDPAPIDRDRTQVFILEIDIVNKKVKKYKTVGRRSIK
jgi:hypothetical protein